MKTYRLKITMIMLLIFSSAIAQTKKFEKTYKTNKDVVVNIDSRNTDVVVDYWDKNEVQVEAVLQGPEAEQKDLQKRLNNWNFSSKATAGEVTITSNGGMVPGGIDMHALHAPLAKLPEMLEPLHKMMVPMLEGISANPLPPQFHANLGDLHFDYEEYKKHGDKYLEKWEKQVEKNFGKDFEKAMEDWAKRFEKDSALWKRRVVVMEDFGEKFGKDMEKWGEEYGKNMEKWGEQFGKDMEKWGEQFGKDMEKWGEHFGKEMEARHGDHKGKVIIINGSESEVKKILKIRMPKEGQLKLNIRYGDVKVAGTSKNIRANLTHSKFSANTLSGNRTEVKAAYTPVQVREWKYGVLDASYAPSLAIDKVTSIKLTSNSSDVNINEIVKNAILRGSFGELVINKLHPFFENVDIVLENSDLKLDLPEDAYSLNYSGTRSNVKFPEGLQLKSSKSYDTQKFQGYNKNKSADATVTINANFSDVLLK